VSKCVEELLSSHILFADDCFLFYRTNDKESNSLKETLDIYGKASG